MVDCTSMLPLGSQEEVRATIRHLSLHARSRNGAPLFQEGTVYFRKNAKRWSLKAYSKVDELQARGHGLPEDIPHRDELLAFASSKLRLELRLHKKQLEERGLEMAWTWNAETPDILILDAVGRLSLPENVALPDEVLLSLPNALRGTYANWQGGHDLRGLYTASTFYRQEGKTRQSLWVLELQIVGCLVHRESAGDQAPAPADALLDYQCGLAFGVVRRREQHIGVEEKLGSELGSRFGAESGGYP